MGKDTIAVIDYGVGNLFSVEKALVYLGANVVVTSDKNELLKARKIILPGVGAFGDCMKNLLATGLVPVLKKKLSEGTPLLGICVGLQILFEGSEESPGVEGLGLIAGTVKRIVAPKLKIPHIGWNSLDLKKGKVNIFSDLDQKPYFYFVHSYHAVPNDNSVITATTTYGEELTAAVALDNIQAVQCHPEKSGDVGLKLLKNFITKE